MQFLCVISLNRHKELCVVVVSVYNDPHWTGKKLEALKRSLFQSPMAVSVSNPALTPWTCYPSQHNPRGSPLKAFSAPLWMVMVESTLLGSLVMGGTGVSA